MESLIFLVIIGSSIWVLIDAKSIGVKKGQIGGLGNLGPWGWFFMLIIMDYRLSVLSCKEVRI
jgi:hypothetical protein